MIRDSRIYGWDTEDDSNGQLVGICLYDVEGNDTLYFTKPAQFFKEIKRRKYSGATFWAHNAEYDIVNLVRKNISKFSKYIVLEGKFKYAELPIGGKHVIHFCDTTNHFPKALAELGKVIGLEKMDDPGISESWNKRKEYCARDAAIVGKSAQFFKEKYGKMGTSLRATVGGSSLELFQRKFLTADCEYRALPLWMLSYFKKAYHGGRTECFRLGTIKPEQGKKIYHYDINGLYPYCMRELKFPHPDTLIFRKNPDSVCLEYEGATNCTVSVNDEFPILPFHHGKLIFPNGRMRGTWTNNLLRYAVEHAGVKIEKLHSTLSATRSDYYLRDFVKYVFSKRREAQEAGDKVMDLVCKLLGNNLYGKFGTMSKPSEWNPETNTFEEKKGSVIPVYTNMIWPAMIPSQGYCTMHPFFDKYSLYTDTDSLHKLRKLAAKYIGKELGQFKLEGEYDEEFILLPKFYYSAKDGKVEYCAKGFPRKFTHDGKTDNPQKDAFQKHFATFRRPLRLRESIRRGLRPNVWVQTTKRIRAEYDKREILPDGFTKPLVISEAEFVAMDTCQEIEERFNK